MTKIKRNRRSTTIKIKKNRRSTTIKIIRNRRSMKIRIKRNRRSTTIRIKRKRRSKMTRIRLMVPAVIDLDYPSLLYLQSIILIFLKKIKNFFFLFTKI
jgi:hypothetical protein